MPVHTIPATVAGNNRHTIRSHSTNWLDARAGANLTANLGVPALFAGQEWDQAAANAWSHLQGFVEFDTSLIPSHEQVTSAQFRVFVFLGLTEGGWFLRIREHEAWGYPLSTGDFVPGADLGALTLRGARSFTGADLNGTYTIPLDIATVNTAGVTKLLVHGSRQEQTHTPTQINRAGEMPGPEQVGGPALIVTTVQLQQVTAQVLDTLTIPLSADEPMTGTTRELLDFVPGTP